MSNPEALHNFDPVIASLIRSKAARLRGLARLNDQDLEDLEQDCRVELLRKLKRFDPDRGKPDAFVARVLRNFLANYLRNRSAGRRDPRRVTSLGGPERAARVSEGAMDRCGRHARPRPDEAELRHDVQTVIADLPPELLDLALRLMRQSVTATARESGVPRTTLQSRVRKLRAVFERHELREYLCRPSSFCDRTG